MRYTAKQILAVFFLLSLGNLSAIAQEPVIEYGQPSELKGISKIYVHTGLDIELRQKIAADIKSKLPNLTICDKPEDAEVFLLFNTNSQRFLTGVISTTNGESSGSLQGTGTTMGDSTMISGTYSDQTSSTTSSSRLYGKFEDGSGYVFKRIGDNRFRALMSFADSRKVSPVGFSFERKPRVNFVRKFVTAYKEANTK